MTDRVPPRTPDTLRFATYNLRHGMGHTDDRVDLDRYARAVAALDADVLAVQEAERDNPRTRYADLTGIAARELGADHWHFAPTQRGMYVVWVRAGRPGRGARRLGRLPSYGIGLISRHPVDWWRRLDLPRLPLRERLPRRGVKPRSMAHRFFEEPRVALAARVVTPQGPVTVVATHLTVVPDATSRQLQFLVDACADLPRPLVLLGDLNLRSPEPAQVSGWSPLVDAKTHPVDKPVRQIDHVLADGDVRVVGEGAAINTGLSDHRALVVDVALG